MDLKTLQDTPPWDWPRDAGKRFQEILIDHRANESDRLVAAELAGDLTVINDKLADSLTAIIRSPDEPERLRARAAISLGPVLEQAETDGFEDPDDVPITQRTFRNIQDSLRKLHFDNTIPKEVRRRVLEGSVRASESWHQNAIRAAYSSGDKDWMLTAVFSMRWVRGFDDQILEALKSADPEIHYEAVQAAGNWGLAAAWSHIVALVHDAGAPKPLLLAAIGAVASIRPAEARRILVDLAGSDDEEIAEAADEAIGMAETASDEEDDEEVGSEWMNCAAPRPSAEHGCKGLRLLVATTENILRHLVPVLRPQAHANWCISESTCMADCRPPGWLWAWRRSAKHAQSLDYGLLGRNSTLRSARPLRTLLTRVDCLNGPLAIFLSAGP